MSTKPSDVQGKRGFVDVDIGDAVTCTSDWPLCGFQIRVDETFGFNETQRRLIEFEMPQPGRKGGRPTAGYRIKPLVTDETEE